MKHRHGHDEVRNSFEQFVGESAGPLLRTGYLIVWDLSVAEDLVQECFFRVARRWPRVRAMDYPVAYARRVLVNLALDAAEQRSRDRSKLDGRLGDEPADESAERALQMVDVAHDLTDALRTLTPRQRSVLALRYFEDLSEAQVAEVMGCSVGTVKSTASRALERLRQARALDRADLFHLPHDLHMKGAGT